MWHDDLTMLHLLPPLFRSGKGKAKAKSPTSPASFKKNLFVAPAPSDEGSCAITAAADKLLRKSVTFEGGGYGASVSRFGGRTHIEWRNLGIARTSQAPVTEADRFCGITRRDYVHLRCDAHRRWNAKDGEWTAWETGGYAIFPGVIVVEHINGRCYARAEGIDNFSPGNPRSHSVEVFGMEMSLAV